MEELINRVLPGQGWGEFYYSENDRDIEPKIVPTASALLALSRYRRFRSTDECERSLGWLCRRLLENHNTATYEIALGSLALIEYDTLRNKITEFERAVQFCKQYLEEWATTRQDIQLGIREEHHYASSMDGSRGNKYLFFLTDSLVALAFLKWNSPQRTRNYVLNVLNFFIKQILDKGGFAPDPRRQFSTVNHLWIYRLLREFESKPVEKVLPQSLYTWSAATRRGRVIISSSLFVVSVLATYVYRTISEPTYRFPALVVAIVAVSSAAVVAIFGRTIWEFFMKGESS
jgi:hypothetical protein